MKKEYKVRYLNDSTNILFYEVIQVVTTYGERTSAYESEPNTVDEYVVFRGQITECYTYIKLQEGGYMY